MILKMKRRRGVSVSELLVAGTLLITALGLLSRGTVSVHGLQRDARQYQIAIDELSNQLDRITALPPSQLETELIELHVSDWAAGLLPNAGLSADRFDDANGQRLKLSLDWDRSGDSLPVSLVGWLAQPDTEVDVAQEDAIDSNVETNQNIQEPPNE